MKDFSTNSNNIHSANFLTGYRKEGNEIIATYSGGHEISYSNSKETINYLQETMKKQVLDNYPRLTDQKKTLFYYNFSAFYNVLFTANAVKILATNNNGVNRIVSGGGLIIFLFAIGFWLKKGEKISENISELKKYKFFIDNEDIINYEICKRYMDENDTNSINDKYISTLSINDIDDYTLIELKEMVELIKQAYPEEELDEGIKLYRQIKGTN